MGVIPDDSFGYRLQIQFELFGPDTLHVSTLWDTDKSSEAFYSANGGLKKVTCAKKWCSGCEPERKDCTPCTPMEGHETDASCTATITGSSFPWDAIILSLWGYILSKF